MKQNPPPRRSKTGLRRRPRSRPTLGAGSAFPAPPVRSHYAYIQPAGKAEPPKRIRNEKKKSPESPEETANEFRPTPSDLIKSAHAEPRGETKNSDCPDPGDGRGGGARRRDSFRAAPGRRRPRQQNKGAERGLLESRLLREPQETLSL